VPRTPIPGFIKPQLATLKTKAPSGDWLHEIKYDGYRVQLHTDHGTKKAYTRNGLNWVERFRSSQAHSILRAKRSSTVKWS
jgi:bifunctional non-homologous end joining protein LigD